MGQWCEPMQSMSGVRLYIYIYKYTAQPVIVFNVVLYHI